MPILLAFLLGYGVCAWLAYQEDIDRNLERIENYANYVREDDLGM